MKSKAGFDIKYIFFAYVPPYQKDNESITIETDVLKKQTKATEYLFDIFDNAIDKARTEIIFTSGERQNNIIRNQILGIAQKQVIAQKNVHAKKLADYLYYATDERNGTGLFTIIEGQKSGTTRLILLRFKGDEALYNHGKKLLVDYLPEVFTKKNTHYKMAVFEDILSEASFWKGFAIDKQISSNTYKQISFFWVEEFLKAKTALTPAQGTLQFSKVIKKVLSETKDIGEQEEIISGIVNLRRKRNVQISVADFCKTYLSPKVTDRVFQEMESDDFYNSIFSIDTALYTKELGKTVLSLQDGITAFVPSFNYEKHVTERINNDGSKNIVIEGRLQNKKIHVERNQKKAKK